MIHQHLELENQSLCLIVKPESLKNILKFNAEEELKLQEKMLIRSTKNGISQTSLGFQLIDLYTSFSQTTIILLYKFCNNCINPRFYIIYTWNNYKLS